MSFLKKGFVGGIIGSLAATAFYVASDAAAAGVLPNVGEFMRVRWLDVTGGAVGGAMVGALAAPSGWLRSILASGLGGLGGGALAHEVRLSASIGIGPGRAIP